MGGDLGTGDDEVHARDVHANAAAVTDYWFALPPEKHFATDEALDAEIAARFGALRAGLLASGAAGWRNDRDTMLAAIIVLDQFSRNIHRDNAEAFAADPLAQTLSLSAIRRGWQNDLPPDRAVFMLMPLMHAESRVLQQFSVECFTALGLDEQSDYARKHARVIERFGRFPSRNDALSRPSRPDEDVFLSEPGSGW